MHHKNDASFVRAGILTMSDTRTENEDKSGALIRSLLEQEGHTVGAYRLINDDAAMIQSVLEEWISLPELDVIITNGGTGISDRDNTVQVTKEIIDKEIEGFGELFRMKNFEEIGAKAMLSRAFAGTRNQTALFVLPGSSNAIQLAMEALILPVLSHVVGELHK